MQHSVQNQHAQLSEQLSVVPLRIFSRRLRRNGNISEEARARVAPRRFLSAAAPEPGRSSCGKSENVRGSPFFSVRLIEPRNLRIAHKADRHVASLDPDLFAHAFEKPLERSSRNSDFALTVQNHSCCTSRP